MYITLKKISIIIFILVIHVDLYSQQIELLALYDTSNTNLKSDYITCVTKDTAGNVWVGTYSNGIAKYNGTEWLVYDTINSNIGSNNIKDIIALKNGDIWIATEDNGISVFDGNQWSIYNTSNCELSGNNIYEIIQDDDGNIWVGIEYESLMMFDGSDWHTFPNIKRATDIYLDFHNNLWLVDDYFNYKIYVRYHQAKTWDSITLYKYAHKVNNVIADKNGIIWLSAITWSSNYIYKYDGINWEKYTPANSGLGSQHYVLLKVDNKNNKWFISKYGNISKFDGRNWLNYHLHDLFPDMTLFPYLPTDFYIDEENILWFATPAGLLKVKEKNYFFDINHKLRSDSISIYPNPTTGSFNVSFPGNYHTAQIKICSLDGTLVYNKQHKKMPVTINLSRAGKGIYVVNIIAGKNCYTRKVVIQ